jgi:hypothetical protein
MSNIAYTYEIISVNEQARVMEVVYASPGRQTMHIGARLPYQGETVEAIVDMYAPVRFWEEQEAAVVVPQVGVSGSVTPPGVEPTTLGSAKQAKKAEIAAWRYLEETKGVSLGGSTIKTDRESQATISGAYSSLKDGLIASVDWKTADGAFVTLGITEIAAIAQAVAQHVQSSFTAEKTLALQVDAATTIEEVQAIVVPWPQAPSQIPVTEV